MTPNDLSFYIYLLGIVVLFVLSYRANRAYKVYLDMKEQLIKKMKEMEEENVRVRSVYIDALMDVYDLANEFLKTRDYWTDISPELKKRFDSLAKMQKTMSDTIMKLELSELGLKVEDDKNNTNK